MKKIVIFNQSDIDGGAARATNRIYKQLKLSKNFKLNFLVTKKLSNDKDILVPKIRFVRFIYLFFPRVEVFIKKVYSIKTCFPWILNYLSLPVNLLFSGLKFDLLHLNWLGKGSLDIYSLHKCNKPVLVTMHDMWLVTGGCNTPRNCEKYKFDCTECPQVNLNKFNKKMANLNLEKKIKYLNSLDLHVTVPSKWMYNNVIKSKLLPKSLSVIPNGLDTKKFKKGPNNLFNDNMKIILFGAMYAETDSNKGLNLLIQALNSQSFIVEKVKLIIFGNSNPIENLNIPSNVILEDVGLINNDEDLIKLYSKSTLTVVPSIEESFGQVACESLACSTPVVCFDTSGLRDIVSHLVCGYVSRFMDVNDLAYGMSLIVNDPKLRDELANNSRNVVLEKFDIEQVSKKFEQLYVRILDEK